MCCAASKIFRNAYGSVYRIDNIVGKRSQQDACSQVQGPNTWQVEDTSSLQSLKNSLQVQRNILKDDTKLICRWETTLIIS